ncbi:MAG: bile acid:sodium symporter family protein [Paenalcaligenes sp.]
MRKLFQSIESHLVVWVVVVAASGLIWPVLGAWLASSISLLLALLMLVISLTFDARAVKVVLKKPSKQVLALFLVYVPMSFLGWLTGRWFFGQGALADGQTLLGMLPTDVSAPLLVLMAKGNVALAAVLNAVNTALAPFIIPFLFLGITGVELDVPLWTIVAELIAIVLLPTLLGVWLRTRFTAAVSRYDTIYAGAGSLLYLLILLAVIAPNAHTILDYGWYAWVIAAAALCLNMAGYAVGLCAKIWITDRQDVIAYLFTVSKKEFSIAAAFVAASGLPAEVAIPAVFFAIVQMLTSPVVARLLTRHTVKS